MEQSSLLQKQDNSESFIPVNLQPDENLRDRLYFYLSHPTWGVFHTGTVMSAAIQLAIYSGFSEIYLFGFDISNAGQPRFYESKDDKVRCGLLHDYENHIEPFIRLVADYCELRHNEIKIYNCSPISRVPRHLIPFFDYKNI